MSDRENHDVDLTEPPPSTEPAPAGPATGPASVGRRTFLTRAAAVAVAGVGGKLAWDRFLGGPRADVVILKAPSYDADLVRVIREGLTALGVDRSWVRGKSVMLKPNLVEPNHEAPHINTHPAVVRAAAEVFRGLDAREVFVAEGQGHCPDSDYVLDESGLGPVLAKERIPFVDLNHDDVFPAPNRLGASTLSLVLPRTLRRADILVSMPKMKTHHWAGVTLSMKNLFGVMPGAVYGWPKSPLHNAGIFGPILDITAAVSPQLAIVDAVVGMEGDGPIMGTPRPVGALVMGANLPSVDATAARLMGFDPERIPYLAAASGRLGPISESRIRQRGETIASLAQGFQVLDHPAMREFRS